MDQGWKSSHPIGLRNVQRVAHQPKEAEADGQNVGPDKDAAIGIGAFLLQAFIDDAIDNILRGGGSSSILPGIIIRTTTLLDETLHALQLEPTALGHEAITALADADKGKELAEADGNLEGRRLIEGFREAVVLGRDGRIMETSRSDLQVLDAAQTIADQLDDGVQLLRDGLHQK